MREFTADLEDLKALLHFKLAVYPGVPSVSAQTPLHINCMDEKLRAIDTAFASIQSRVIRGLRSHDKLLFTAIYRDAYNDVVDRLCVLNGGCTRQWMKKQLGKDFDDPDAHARAQSALKFAFKVDLDEFDILHDFTQEANKIAHQPIREGMDGLLILKQFTDEAYAATVQHVLPTTLRREKASKVIPALSHLYGSTGVLPVTDLMKVADAAAAPLMNVLCKSCNRFFYPLKLRAKAGRC